MAKKLIIGNWKMNPSSVKEAERLFKDLSKAGSAVKHATLLACLPASYLHVPSKLKLKKIILGAQDVSQDTEGAHTGEVSAKMLSSVGAKYVIIGHSECRANGDTNQSIQKKMQESFKAKLIPILCIGESVRDTNGSYLSFIKQQLTECLIGVSKAQMKNLVIAYEPVWAIGANALREATSEEFIEIRIFIRKTISDMYDAKTAHAIPVVYGGSAHPENAREFLGHGGADGLLVGRDSLNVKKWSLIVEAAK